ncbi:MAG: helix-turn-helix domain-containing protein [Proteobacteria bacterium]|nr:helix-turn-helix domain-containing protein [Pseudomonadota bacterium]MBI3499742.1 helix-turn-helix domain-containing protein [Pseudomonadota bacterium]
MSLNSSIMVSMNKLTSQKRTQILGMMVEGMSIRAIARLTGASKNTIVKLLEDAGRACAEYQNQALRDLPCKRLQLDEIWAFVYTKAKNAPAEMKASGDAGDVWTWTAICADTKLAVSWFFGSRDGDAAKAFVCDVAQRLKNRVQITTDGHKPYIEAVETAFGADVDYARLIKIYGQTDEGQRRSSSPQIIGTETQCCTGNLDPRHISTSYAEHANLTMRMHMRRFTRLTNAFSKKVENHAHAVALNFMYYNFVRIHQSIRCTPAMAVGVTKTLWSIEDIVCVVDEWEITQRAA